MEFIEYLREFNLLSVVVRLLISVIIGGAIGLERESHGRSSGLRTHILVCIGSAMTSLTAAYVVSISGFTGDIFRISAQVISGIGFLGAGTILVRKANIVTGLTTAAGMWVTASAGIAVGYGFYSGAIICCVIMLITINIFKKFEKKIRHPKRIYIEVEGLSNTNEAIDKVKSVIGKNSSAYIIPSKSGYSGNIGINARLDKTLNITETLEKIRAMENIVYAVED